MTMGFVREYREKEERKKDIFLIFTLVLQTFHIRCSRNRRSRGKRDAQLRVFLTFMQTFCLLFLFLRLPLDIRHFAKQISIKHRVRRPVVRVIDVDTGRKRTRPVLSLQFHYGGLRAPSTRRVVYISDIIICVSLLSPMTGAALYRMLLNKALPLSQREREKKRAHR